MQRDDRKLSHNKGVGYYEELRKKSLKPTSLGHLRALGYLNTQVEKYVRATLYEWHRWDVEQGLTNLTSFGCQLGYTSQAIARATRGRGWGRRGSAPRTDKGSSTSEARRGCKLVECLIVEAATSYRDGMDAGIQKLIEDWEADIKQESESEE